MNNGSHRRLVNSQTESDGSNENASFVGHPSFLVPLTNQVIHLSVVRYGGDAMTLQEIDGFLNSCHSGRVHNDICARVGSDTSNQELFLGFCVAFLNDVTQIRTMKTGNVFVGLPQSELIQDVVPYPLR